MIKLHSLLCDLRSIQYKLNSRRFLISPNRKEIEKLIDDLVTWDIKKRSDILIRIDKLLSADEDDLATLRNKAIRYGITNYTRKDKTTLIREISYYEQATTISSSQGSASGAGSGDMEPNQTNVDEARVQRG